MQCSVYGMQNRPGGRSPGRNRTVPPARENGGNIVSQTEDRVSVRRTDQPIERIRAVNNLVGKPDPRDGIPVLGFPEYWYPLIAVGRVPNRKPAFVKILGESSASSTARTASPRSRTSAPTAARGSPRGAATTRGPSPARTTASPTTSAASASRRCPKAPSRGCPGTSASVSRYPTRTLKGIVFVWMGDGEPSARRVDLPPELFDRHARHARRDDLAGQLATGAGELPGRPRAVRPPQLARAAMIPSIKISYAARGL